MNSIMSGGDKTEQRENINLENAILFHRAKSSENFLFLAIYAKMFPQLSMLLQFIELNSIQFTADTFCCH